MLNDNSGQSSLKKITVMIVEDDYTTARVASALCASFGYETHTASNGLEALQLLSEKRFDVIFMDLQMPVMGGFEAAYEIRQDGSTKDIPIIAVSGSVDNEQQMRSRLMGMDAFMPKPYTLEGVRRMVCEYVPVCEAVSAGDAAYDANSTKQAVI